MIHMTAPLAARITTILIAASFLWLLPVDSVAAAPIPQGAITIEFETVASGLTAPVGVTHAGDGSGRLFITEQTGQIRLLQGGVLLPTPFLDISGKLLALDAAYDERGLLGLAFHPEYQQNGRFFVRYSAPRAGDASEPCFGTSRGCHEEILAEYAVSSTDPNLADNGSEIILFRIDEPQFNHNAGEVAFGPDGFLNFSLGDGGGANDELADVPPSHGPIGNGQNIETPLGAILRIDVDLHNVCHNKKKSMQVGSSSIDAHLAHGDSLGACDVNAATQIYGIPHTNPFHGAPGVDEIYAYGMRNPFRFSFDDGPGGGGSLFLADVGQNLFEEVNIIELGGNYGWVIREGANCFDPFNPTNPPSSCSVTGPNGEPLIDPIVQYSHPGSGFDPEGGITVIGGFVYRGSGFPDPVGHYIFGDFSLEVFNPSGSLYYVEGPEGHNPEIQQFQIGNDDRSYGMFLKSFGEDEDGEIYVAGSAALAPSGSTGVVQRTWRPKCPGQG